MKSFVVIGIGRFGSAVATRLFQKGHEVLVIDIDEAKIQQIADSVTKAVAADAKDMSILRALGVRNYDAVVLAVGGDIGDSVIVTMQLKELGIQEIICKARNYQHEKILQKLGADRVIIPEREMGNRLAVQLGSVNILEFIELTGTYGLSEVRTPKKWVGKSIKELDIRRKYGLNIIGIKESRGSEDMDMSIDGDTFLKEGNVMVLVGSNEKIARIDTIE